MTSILDQLEAAEKAATKGPRYAVVNDLIGGWLLANRDVPAHALDTRKGSTDYVFADFCSEEDAHLIALLCNHAAELIALARTVQGMTNGTKNQIDVAAILAPLLVAGNS